MFRATTAHRVPGSASRFTTPVRTAGWRRLLAAAAAFALAVGWSGPARGQLTGSAFTYQGKLDTSGNPLTDTADFQFALWSAGTGGAQVGSTIGVNNVSVVDGLFTVALDFGVGAIDGSPRWLQIAVRSPAGGGGFTTLSPRQPLTVAPVAWHAMRPWQATTEGGYSLTLPTTNGQVNGVGIGTNNVVPAARLHVRTGAFFPAEAMRVEDFFARSQLRISTPESEGRAAFQAWNGQTNAAGPLSLNAAGGNVGIGTDAPAAKLDVAGSFETDGFKLNGNGAAVGRVLTSDASGVGSWQPFTPSQWTTNGSNISYSGGNVGVGTIAPGMSLEVTRPSYYAQPAIGGSTATTHAYLHVAGDHSLIWNSTSAMRFGTETSRGAGYSEKVRISGNGNVGIGTSTPTAMLQVGTGSNFSDSATAGIAMQAGDTVGLSIRKGNSATVPRLQFCIDGVVCNYISMTSEGDLQVENYDLIVPVLRITGGSDLAEPFNVRSDEASERPRAEAQLDVQPGMVVAIDPRQVGELRISDKAYDRTVAGIISGANGVNPGMVLSQAGTVANGKHPVALTGRVWCWCDADAGGPITAGDLLTTADTPGHAMRAADPDRAHGAVIGKAMSALQSGKGLVLVLVNLQ